VLDAGSLNVEDGELWQGDGSASPDPSQGTTTAVPAGTPDVSLLLAHSTVGATPLTDVAAVEVRLRPQRPVVWRQETSLGGGTDGGVMGLAGTAALHRLASVRSFDDEQADIDATGPWLTPCLRYTVAGEGSAGSDSIEIELTGDGGWPGAIGYDETGAPVDVLLSTTILPWSLLGLPGTPPAQAVADEPTASASARPTS
jgi:hypothetical protein